MEIVVVGLGYVGLLNAVLLAQHNDVIGVDISQERVDALNARQSPIVDAELSEYLAEKDLNLSASTDLKVSVTCARDIAQTCISIAEQLILDPRKSGIYHYSGQPNVSWCQFANTIFEQMGSKTIASPIPTTEFPTPALRPLNSRLDCEATQDIFGISRPFWKDGLEAILIDLEGEYDKA